MNNNSLPQTFVIECNRANSVLQSNKTANNWTTNIPSLQLRRGDAVRINQAFCSSQGVGDLIDVQGDNNKSRIIFEYYVNNDGANDKIHEQSGLFEEGNVSGGKTYTWFNAHIFNYRPARLYRFMETGTYTAKGVDDPSWIEGTIRGKEDEFVPCLYRNPVSICKLNSFSSVDVNVRDYVRLMSRGQVYPDITGRRYENPFIVFGSTEAIEFARNFVKGCAYRFHNTWEQRLVPANKSRINCVPFIVKEFYLIDNGGTDELIMECYMGDVRPPADYTLENDFLDYIATAPTAIKIGSIAGASNIYCMNIPTKGYETGDAGIYNIYPVVDYELQNSGSEYYNYTEGYGSDYTLLNKVNDGVATITEQFNGTDTLHNKENFVGVEPVKTGSGLVSELKMMPGINGETYITKALTALETKVELNDITDCDGQYIKLVDYEDNGFEWVYLYSETAVPALGAKELFMLRGQLGTIQRAFVINSGVFFTYSHFSINPRIKMFEGKTYLSQAKGITFDFHTKTYNGGGCFMMNNGIPTHTELDYRNTMLQVIDTPIKNGTLMSATGADSWKMKNYNSQSWEIHYGYQDVEISKTYFSPSDIGDEITKQLHDIISIPKANTPQDSYENSKGGGIPRSKMLIPVIGPSRTTGTYTHNYNTLDGASGMLNGPYHNNDFACKIYEIDGLVKPDSEATGTVSLGSGTMILTSTDDTYAIPGTWWWIKGTAGVLNSGYFKVVSISSSKAFLVKGVIDGMTAWKGRPATHHKVDTTTNHGDYFLWFRNRDTPLWNKEFSNTTCRNTMKVETAPTNEVEKSPYPVLYYDSELQSHDYIYTDGKEFVSQMIGASNPTLNWNTTINRFEWSNIHQPYISTFVPAGTGTGGTPACRIWLPKYKGLDNIVKVGGCNIVNWAGKIMTINQYSTEDTDWENPLTILNTDGENFWNTLGFSSNWLETYKGNTYYDTADSRGYRPLGTTRANIDSSEGLIQTTTPVENEPKQSGIAGGAIGGEDIKGHDRNYGIPNTAGTPVVYTTTSPATKNPDQNIRRSYEVIVNSNTLSADLLPIKTKVPYFLIISDIVDTAEFYGPKGNVAVMGILSKNYQNSDFFFSFQSPTTYYIRKDRVISSITTTIVKPDLTNPINISLYSSVIYEIMREPQEPTPSSMPIWEEQALDYQIAKQTGLTAQYYNPHQQIINAMNELNPEGKGNVSFGVASGVGTGGEPIPTGTMPDLTDNLNQLITPDDPRWEIFYTKLANYTQTIEADHLNVVRELLKSAPPALVNALSGGDEDIQRQLRYAVATNDSALVSKVYLTTIRPNLFRYQLAQGKSTRQAEGGIQNVEGQLRDTRLASMIEEGEGDVQPVSMRPDPHYDPSLLEIATEETGVGDMSYQQVLHNDAMIELKSRLEAKQRLTAIEKRKAKAGEAMSKLTGVRQKKYEKLSPLEELMVGGKGEPAQKPKSRRERLEEAGILPLPKSRKERFEEMMREKGKGGGQPRHLEVLTAEEARAYKGQTLPRKKGGAFTRKSVEADEAVRKMNWSARSGKKGFYAPRRHNEVRGRVGTHTDGTGWAKPYGWSLEKQKSGMYKRYSRGKGGYYPDKKWIERHGKDFKKYNISRNPPKADERRKHPTHTGDLEHNKLLPHRPQHTTTATTERLSKKYYRENPTKLDAPATQHHQRKQPK